MDVEWRVTYQKGQKPKVTLLQLSSHKTTVLFRLNKIEMCDEIINFFSLENVYFVGIGIKEDFMKLKQEFNIIPKNIAPIEDLDSFYRCKPKHLG